MEPFALLDFIVAAFYLAFAMLTGYRGAHKLWHYRNDRGEGQDGAASLMPGSSHRLNGSGPASQPLSFTAAGALLVPADGRDADEDQPAPQASGWSLLVSDRRVATICLLLLITTYSIVRVAYLTLGACGAIPMDGSIRGNFASEIPAAFFMLFQTAMIAKWGIHARDSEWILHARTVSLHVRCVITSAVAAFAEIAVTAVAIVDFRWHIVGLSGDDWNAVVSACCGLVYLLNGIIFVALGLRLFFMWRAAFRMEQGDDLPESTAPGDAHYTPIRNAVSNPTCCGCLGGDVGSRGYRILGVAFAFGLLLCLRAIGLLSYVIAQSRIHQANHSHAAAPLALLFEVIFLFVVLRLLMPPGNADGERDVEAASARRRQRTLNRERTNAPGTATRTLSSAATSETAARRTAASGRGAAHWAQAHMLDENTNASPSESWRVANQDDEDADEE